MRFRRLRSYLRWVVGISSAGAAALVGYACSSSSHPAGIQEVDGSVSEGGKFDGSSGSSGSSSGTDGASTDGASTDGQRDGTSSSGGDSGGDAQGGTCNDLTADGPLVPDAVGTGTIPTPAGGIIFQGTYWLSARYNYGGTPDGQFLQRSIVVDATTWNVVEGRAATEAGAPTLSATSAGWQTLNPAILSLSITCPGPKHLANLDYSAGGPQLTLFPTNEVMEVYDLQ